jgi:hypothetical protein
VPIRWLRRSGAGDLVHLFGDHFESRGRLEGGGAGLVQIEADQFAGGFAVLRIVGDLAEGEAEIRSSPALGYAHQRLVIADLAGGDGAGGAGTCDLSRGCPFDPDRRSCL